MYCANVLDGGPVLAGGKFTARIGASIRPYSRMYRLGRKGRFGFSKVCTVYIHKNPHLVTPKVNDALKHLPANFTDKIIVRFAKVFQNEILIGRSKRTGRLWTAKDALFVCLNEVRMETGVRGETLRALAALEGLQSIMDGLVVFSQLTPREGKGRLESECLLDALVDPILTGQERLDCSQQSGNDSCTCCGHQRDVSLVMPYS